MTLPGNGTTKKVIASIVAALCIFLVSQVLSNSNRITAMEERLDALMKNSDRSLAQAEKNWDKNDAEHKDIQKLLNEISREVKK